MTDTCPKCGRRDYTGATRTLQADECGLADGASCRAYLYGLEVGRAERRHPLYQLDTTTGEVRVLDAEAEKAKEWKR